MPFSSPNQKPSRNEALEYYRKVAEHYKLEFRQYQTVSGVTGVDGDFTITTIDRFSRHRFYGARKVVIATGYYDLPNYLEVPGEELPKVLHYYHDPHPYYDQKVLVVGGKNSAAIAALDLWRHGAHVTLVHRGEKMHHHVKYWILPDINNRIKNGEVTAHFSSSVTRITEDAVDLLTPDGAVTIDNDYVFALTGYHPDFDFLAGLGVRIEGQDRCPACDPQSLESNISGIYLAGVIVAGMRTNEIFIENGRFHGGQIAHDIEAKLAGTTPVKVG
jgi:thioredoxin reductase (NADPH)